LPTLASTHSIINPTPHPQSYTLSLHDALPISGATVALSGSSANPTTTSGARGEYTFRNVPNGTYKLTVTLVGFANGTRDNITVSGQNVEVPPITLAIASLTDTVVVSATKSDAKLIDAPAPLS